MVMISHQSPQSDLNQRPTLYKSVALPLSYRGNRSGGTWTPTKLPSTDFKSGASTDSATLPKNHSFQVGGWNLQYSLNVIFISLLVRLAFFAAFGKFHFAANNISIDWRVFSLIFATLKNFFVKPYRVNFCRDFFWGFFGIKAHFSLREDWNTQLYLLVQ